MRWILKKFWFPILLIVLKMLSKRYPWAGKAYNGIVDWFSKLPSLHKQAGELYCFLPAAHATQSLAFPWQVLHFPLHCWQ